MVSRAPDSEEDLASPAEAILLLVKLVLLGIPPVFLHRLLFLLVVLEEKGVWVHLASGRRALFDDTLTAFLRLRGQAYDLLRIKVGTLRAALPSMIAVRV